MASITVAQQQKLPFNNVVVHPLVLLSVVDHYNRADQTQGQRVCGILLGEVFNGKIDVTNSYAVPFDEDAKSPDIWYLDHNYIEKMTSMFHKISSKEKVVGWYSTGPQIRPADLAINELVRRYVDHPVLVIVDVNPTDNLEIPTQAYVSMEDVPEKRSVSPKTFVHLPSEIGAYEAEEVGVEHLVREIRDIGGSTVADMVSDKIASLKGMLKRLGQIEEYLDLVMAKKVVANHQIMYNIQNIFNSMPALDTKDIIQSFKVVTNDNSLVLYVSSLIRSILALDGVISNKIKNRNIEAARLADLEAAALAKETAAIEAEKAKTEEKKTMDTNED